MDEETLVLAGTEVKALGEGKIGGHLVLFGDATKTDLAKDFFTAKTEFGSHDTSMVLYQHGMDPVLKGRVFDYKASLRKDDIGVWIEAQLALRDDYEQAIYGMAKAGKLGWSSGTASHMVTREQVGKAYHIKSWPLGLDASLTPTPCESRTSAVTLKSITTEFKSSLLAGLDFDDHSDMVLTACREYVKRAQLLCERRARDGRTVSSERVEAFKSLYADMATLIDAAKPDTGIADLKRTFLQRESQVLTALAGG